MYRAAGEFTAPPQDADVLIAIENPRGLSLWFDPGWRKVIRLADQPYFEKLLADTSIRAKEAPEGLLKQLSEINSGPIITGETGFLESASPRIREELKRFTPASTGTEPGVDGG